MRFKKMKLSGIETAALVRFDYFVLNNFIYIDINDNFHSIVYRSVGIPVHFCFWRDVNYL